MTPMVVAAATETRTKEPKATGIQTETRGSAPSAAKTAATTPVQKPPGQQRRQPQIQQPHKEQYEPQVSQPQRQPQPAPTGSAAGEKTATQQQQLPTPGPGAPGGIPTPTVSRKARRREVVQRQKGIHRDDGQTPRCCGETSPAARRTITSNPLDAPKPSSYTHGIAKHSGNVGSS